MNQVEIIKAILAGEALEWFAPTNSEWRTFTGAETPEYSLAIYLGGYMADKFRRKPKIVHYQTRAYLHHARTYVWTSSYDLDQEVFASDVGGDFRWLEETQEKQYTL